MRAGIFYSGLMGVLAFCISFSILPNTLNAQQEMGSQGIVSSPSQISGYKFSTWSADGAVKVDSPDKTSSKATFAPNDKSATVSAAFTPDEKFCPLLNIRITGHGSTSPAAGQNRCPDGSITVKATAANEFKFSKWELKGDATLADPKAAETVVTIKDNAELTAVFVPTLAVLRCSTWGSGTTIPAVGQAIKVPLNEAQEISAQAFPGYRFAKWNLSGKGKIADPSAAKTTVTLEGEAHVCASFVGDLSEFGVSSECEPVVGDPSGARALGEKGPNVSVNISVAGTGSTIPTPGLYKGNPCRLNVQARPAKDWVFEKWKTDGNISIDDPASPEATLTVKGGGSLVAIFAADNVSLSLRSCGKGTTRPAPKDTLTVKANQPQAISAIPEEGQVFMGWQVSGPAVLANPKAAQTSATLKGNTTLIAIFAAPPRPEAPKPPPAAAKTAAPENKQQLGTIINVSPDKKVFANAPAGYRFEKWTTEGGISVADSKSASTTMRFEKDSSNANLTAHFIPENTSLSLAVEGQGSTKPAAGKPELVPLNKAIQIEAVPSNGNHFIKWETEGPLKIADANALKTSATLSGSASATAVFAPNTAMLTIELIGGGETKPQSGTAELTVNAPSALSASPLEGFRFSEWVPLDKNARVADTKSPKTSLTLSGNATIRAIFMPNSATLTLGVSGDGQTSPAACLPITVKTDSWQQVEAIPAPNYDFVNWSVTGDAQIATPDERKTQIIVRSGTALLIANMKPLAQEKTDSAGAAERVDGSKSLKTAAAAKADKSSSTQTPGGSSALAGMPAPAAPKQIVATDGEYADKVQIRWGESSGATRYEVWRAGEKESLAKAARIVSAWAGNTYNDVSAEPGVTYKYWVRAENTSGTSYFSGSDTGFRRK
ncbi:MAG: hypothetical protein A2X49_13965 [Lentisphaerae bacterium GWF2_52_8]|nr:MAG: hypothetical protein A2X49_13965 [Lentisphaerae bacterium GWF2_52_8]